ncbi:uncharacterized protein LOC133035576 [Cannabis sativa]|uniref:uncharacterized protein LOC133035576 n=1 Tax=Cannabis sativa TaxID=3483 RepID=UPI0029CA128C|nr:uncharacterized protein LOC133035576 [Cannabis sativa]
MATQSLIPYKRPDPMKKDTNKRDMTKFCQFHGDYGHDTNECYNLKREIEYLIKKNNPHLKKYVEANQGQNNHDLLPPPIDGRLQVIIGGPHIAGDTGKARERYARIAQYEQEEVILVVEERKPKVPRAKEPTITFTDEDAVQIKFPHNDQLYLEYWLIISFHHPSLLSKLQSKKKEFSGFKVAEEFTDDFRLA